MIETVITLARENMLPSPDVSTNYCVTTDKEIINLQQNTSLGIDTHPNTPVMACVTLSVSTISC